MANAWSSPTCMTDPRLAKRIDEMTKWETQSIICIPLRSKHRVLGVIQLVNVEDGTLHRSGSLSFCNRFAITPRSPLRMPCRSKRSRNSPSPTTAPAFTTHAISTKRLETEVYRSSRFGYEFSVLFIDLDHFKQVNDTHGHLIGSKLLAEIGYLIKAQLRLIDFAFRYGGDEFVVLLPQTGKDAALVVARACATILRTSMFCQEEGLNLNVRASMGVATYPHDAKSPRRRSSARPTK